MSGQLHAPALLRLVKEPPVSLGQKAEWNPEPVAKRKKSHPRPYRK